MTSARKKWHVNNTYRGLMDERDDWRQQFDTACEMIQQQSAEIARLRAERLIGEAAMVVLRPGELLVITCPPEYDATELAVCIEKDAPQLKDRVIVFKNLETRRD